MRYWKCIGANEDYQSVTAGNIYKTYDNGLGLVDDKGYEFKSYTPSEFNAEFEEITYTDYILQEFASGKIAVALKDEDACEYWSELLKEVCVEKDIENGWNFTLVYEEWEDDEDHNFYYIQDNKVRSDGKESVHKRIVLEKLIKVENKKEENKKMEKEFTISDLKGGMIVETREGNLYLIHGNNLMNKNGETRLDLMEYDEDLTDDSGIVRCDIMKVFQSNATVLKDMFNDEELELIWERKDSNLTKEYKFGDIAISPNGENYNDEDDPIYIIKSKDWEDDSEIWLTLDEAEFLVESLKEIISNVKNK